MKKIIFTLFIIHCSLHITNAQWVLCGGFGGYSVTSLATYGNNIFVGECHKIGNQTFYAYIYKSTDHGISWNQTSFFDTGGSVYSFAIKGNKIFAGSFKLWVSNDIGISWSAINFLPARFLSLAVNGNNIYAGNSSNGVYLSTNNGNSFTQIGLSNVQINCFAFNQNNIFVGTNGGVYFSTNNGLNWTQTGLSTKNVWSLVINGTNIIAGTLEYGTYISTNNGTNWSQTGLNNQSVYSLLVYHNNIFAGTRSGIYKSIDNGASWSGINEGLSGSPNISSLTVDSSYFFAGSFYDCVYRRPLSEIIGIQNISTEIPSSYSLQQNYPNPFNPTTKIKFDIPPLNPPLVKGGRGLPSGGVSLKVYDVMGREVQTLVNESLKPGTYSVDFDATNFPTGIYFYKITAGDFSETRKMILIK